MVLIEKNIVSHENQTPINSFWKSQFLSEKNDQKIYYYFIEQVDSYVAMIQSGLQLYPPLSPEVLPSLQLHPTAYGSDWLGYVLDLLPLRRYRPPWSWRWTSRASGTGCGRIDVRCFTTLAVHNMHLSSCAALVSSYLEREQRGISTRSMVQKTHITNSSTCDYLVCLWMPIDWRKLKMGNYLA